MNVYLCIALWLSIVLITTLWLGWEEEHAPLAKEDEEHGFVFDDPKDTGRYKRHK